LPPLLAAPGAADDRGRAIHVQSVLPQVSLAQTDRQVLARTGPWGA
jgi:hypothetical protein